MTYVKVNLTKSGDNSGKGGDKKDKITIIDADDILGDFPSRDSKGVVITDDIILKPGAYAVDFYATQDSIKLTSKAEGEMDAKGITQSVEFSAPGDAVALLEARQYWMNKNVYAIIHKCSSNRKTLAGAPCALLQFTFNAEDTKDSNKTVFTLQSAQKGPDFADYQGSITYDTVKGTAAANATTVNVAAGEGEYQLTSGTATAAEIGALTNPVHGNVYTLLGSGGAFPSTISDNTNTFLLYDEIPWTAISGARITFRCFDDGGVDKRFIELSRS